MKGEPGTIIASTLRNADLVPAFSRELARLDNAKRYAELQEACTVWIDRQIALDREPMRPTDADHEEVGTELVVELCDALNEYAPPGHYFGTHPGDGADFGYWPHDEAF